MSSILYTNEKQGAYPPSYYAASADPLPAFDPILGEQKCDVCVIGAGFSGLSAALHLRKAGYDVVLLDAHRIGWGASGRNGGQVGSGQRLDPLELEELVGGDVAAKLWNLGEQAKAMISHLTDQYSIECDFVSGVINANHRKSYAEETRRYVDHIQRTYGYENLTYLSQEDLSDIVPTNAYFDGTYDTGAGHLQPLRFSFGLAKACIELGVRIHEMSEVLSIDPGQKIDVYTASALLKTDYLVLAVNGYGGNLDAQVKRHVMPINNFIIATEPLTEDLAKSLISNNAAVADSKYVVNYFRLSSDRRLIFGGRESYRYRFPTDIKSYVRQAMLKVYPHLKDTRIDFGWGGVVGITMNRMPHFQWLSPNMITIGGYSGHGVALATLGGAIAAEAIGGVAERFSLMEAVPSDAFPGGGRLRLPLLSLGMAYYSLLDRLS
ncbi:MAG: FAD-binding oxidoreductase [Pseudomonadota bacterium]